MKSNVCSNSYLTLGASKMGKVKSFSVHVLVAREWVENPDNTRCVDHIDGNKANDHHENLRWASHSENSRNRKIQTNTSSVYKGVSFYKPLQKWAVKIYLNGKNKHLGYFTNEREAAEAYNAAAVEHYKEFARIDMFTDLFSNHNFVNY